MCLIITEMSFFLQHYVLDYRQFLYALLLAFFAPFVELVDMGFEDKIKVHRGKPANQSIMVVQFGGTLSGLLEAQRLHKMYSKIKRGRLEFQLQEKSCNNESHSDETKTSTKELENFLYGYLGTAEDLDKLDFDMKKRCVVKSKKDIQNIAEARLKTVTK